MKFKCLSFEYFTLAFFRVPSGEVNRGTILSGVDASVYRNLDVTSDDRCFCVVTEAL